MNQLGSQKSGQISAQKSTRVNNHTDGSRELSAMDRSFLELHSANTPQFITALVSLGGCVSEQELGQRVLDLTITIPHLKRMLPVSEGQHVNAGHPSRWIEDTSFAVENHLSRVFLEDLLDERKRSAEVPDISPDLMPDLMQVEQALGILLSRDIPVSGRPPWRMSLLCRRDGSALFTGSTLIDDSSGHEKHFALGAPRGETVYMLIVYTVHHSWTDGVGAMEFIYALCDSTSGKGSAKPRAMYMENAPVVTAPRALSGSASWNILRAAGEILREWSGWWGRAWGGKTLSSSGRSVAWMYFKEADLKRVRRSEQCNFIDVLLAIIAYGFELYLRNQNQLPPSFVRTIVPVNLRQDVERYAMGNKLSGAGVKIELSQGGAIAQLKLIAKTMERMRAKGSFALYAQLGTWLSTMPAFLQKIAYKAQAGQTSFISTYLRGPLADSAICGVPVEGIMGFPALMVGHKLGFCYFSYARTVSLGVVVDSASGIDIARLVECLAQAQEELCVAAEEQKGNSEEHDGEK